MTNHVLKHEGRLLEKILGKVQELNQLNQLFLQHLEPELAKHCHVVKLDRGCLVVNVSSGSWGAQLRFCTPDLIPVLRDHTPFQNLKAIVAKVNPNYTPVKKNHARKMAGLSPESAAQVVDTAKTIRNKTLREILERIAKHLRVS